MRPDLIVNVDHERFGLCWDGAVTVLHESSRIIIGPGGTENVTEWQRHDTGRLPAEVAAVISGYCTQKLAREAAGFVDHRWHVSEHGMVKVYSMNTRV
jgi:hypothetical protein